MFFVTSLFETMSILLFELGMISKKKKTFLILKVF